MRFRQASHHWKLFSRQNQAVVLRLDLGHHIGASPSFLHDFFEKRRLFIIIIRPTQYLANLCQSQACFGSPLQQRGRNSHVSQAFGAQFEVLFEFSDVVHYVNISDKIQRFCGKRHVCLGVG
jgi:hypothetical protein